VDDGPGLADPAPGKAAGQTPRREATAMTTLDRRRTLRLGASVAAAVVAAPFVLRPGRARAAEVALRMHHFLPAVSNGHKGFLAPWAKKVEEESQGRIQVRIFPSMQLGGAPPQLFDQARDGVADIVWTLPGNTPGRFPRTEVFELPFVPAKRSIVNSLALQEYATAHATEEFREVHPICLWAHDHGLVHAKRQVHGMEDLKGLKLRFPTRLAGEALKALGASAIGMPIPQVPESLASGVIDGCVIPWEVVPSIKVHELVGHHTEIPGSPTFYVATFVLAMNRARYEGMPDDLRAVIDANSGMAAAAMAGKVWDEAAGPAMELARKRGNEIHILSEEETARWREATAPVVEAWLAQAKGKGLEGEALLGAARALLAKHGQA
jgi:TRAP-type C4-dicarboxylate transport system substrate-binding protein